MTTVTSPMPPAAQSDGVLAVDPSRCAQMLGISRSTTFQLLASGAIKSLRCGRRRLVPVSEIQAYLDRELERQSARQSA